MAAGTRLLPYPCHPQLMFMGTFWAKWTTDCLRLYLPVDMKGVLR